MTTDTSKTERANENRIARNVLKYQPTDDEPRLVAYRRGVWIEGDAEYETLEEVEAEVQRVALAIADRVHGAELAALRAEVESLKAEVERFEAEPAPAPA